MQIYHNPRCRKSREALQLLEEKGARPEVVEYLKTPPTQEELKAVLNKLGAKASDIIRRNEQLFKDNYKGQEHSEDEWIRILADNPKLIERPIVIKGNKAVVGRPPEKVLELL